MLQDAIAHLRLGKTDAALEIFQSIADHYPDEKVSHYYINLLNHLDNKSEESLQIDAV